ncbi:MAG: hypothetical protein JWP48_2625, partial [Actinoallomurus sp.]|nr:hypothetical protein [Actinoallomurus sp.]
RVPRVPEIMEMQSRETHVGERLAPVRLTPEVATPQETAAGTKATALRAAAGRPLRHALRACGVGAGPSGRADRAAHCTEQMQARWQTRTSSPYECLRHQPAARALRSARLAPLWAARVFPVWRRSHHGPGSLVTLRSQALLERPPVGHRMWGASGGGVAGLRTCRSWMCEAENPPPGMSVPARREGAPCAYGLSRPL